MINTFEKVLRTFPFSKLSQSGLWFRIQPVSWEEPDVVEQAFPDDTPAEALLAPATEFSVGDSAVQVEGYWDLWQYIDNDWKLAPSRVVLSVFGPRFESEMDDHIRIDLGLDSLYLPQGVTDNEEPMIQANIRSVLHLASELDRVLRVESRRLWTESGQNFAETLQKVLMSGGAGDFVV